MMGNKVRSFTLGDEIAVNLRIEGIGGVTVMLDDVVARAIFVSPEGERSIELKGKITAADDDGEAKLLKAILWTYGLEAGFYRLLSLPVSGIDERIEIDLEERGQALEFRLVPEPRLSECEIGRIEAGFVEDE